MNTKGFQMLVNIFFPLHLLATGTYITEICSLAMLGGSQRTWKLYFNIDDF